MKNILITGASGFIGKNLAEYLYHKKRQQYSVFTPPHTELDLLDSEKVEAYLVRNGINIIVHAANVGGTVKSQIQDVLNKNLRMFFNLARCRKYLTKMILLGSGAEYDKKSMPPRAKESDFDRFIPSDDYGFSKYVMSKYIEQTEGMINLRMFGVFGRNEDYEYRFISNAIIKNLLKLPIIIRQNVFYDYIYVDDCVRMIEWFIENQADEKFYNLCSGSTIDLYTLAVKVNRIGNYKSNIIILNEGLNTEYSADNSRLMEQIPGFTITPIDVSLQVLYEYYESIIDKVDRDRIRKDSYLNG